MNNTIASNNDPNATYPIFSSPITYPIKYILTKSTIPLITAGIILIKPLANQKKTNAKAIKAHPAAMVINPAPGYAAIIINALTKQTIAPIKQAAPPHKIPTPRPNTAPKNLILNQESHHLLVKLEKQPQ